MNITGFKDYSPDGILKLIQKMAEVYTPEWKIDPLEPDGGYALATLFAAMFSETLNIFNSIPKKYFLYFLNMLGVSLRNATPAKGFVNFDVYKNSVLPVTIKKNTKLYTIKEVVEKGSSETVIFETDRTVQAINSSLIGVFNISSPKDIIEKIQPDNGEYEFFNPKIKNNLESRRMIICNDNVLNLKSPSEITLRFMDDTAYSGNREILLNTLSSKDLSDWFYFDTTGTKRTFKDIVISESGITLIKDDSHKLAKISVKGITGSEHEKYAIICEMKKGNENLEVSISDMQMKSTSIIDEDRQGIAPDYLFYNDIPGSIEEPDYCFGKSPALYDSFYISSDEAFTKPGAEINLEFNIKTVVKEVGAIPSGPVYDFYHKYIVEKSDYTKPVPDQIYISRVQWEYWNGIGWTRLEVRGDHNVFAPSQNIFKRNITFICPMDFSMCYQNSLYGYLIRARILEIENLYSGYGQWNLPFYESIHIKFNYTGNLPSFQLMNVENNCELSVYGEESRNLKKAIITPLSTGAEEVYFAFDTPPKGLPFTIYFGVRGRTDEKRLLVAEGLVKGIGGEPGWKEIRINDTTNALEESGIIEFFTTEDFIKNTLFGQEAFWIRLYDGNMKYNNNIKHFPLVDKIILNAVPIVQRNTVEKERHKVLETIEGLKYITLRNNPIILCEIWVDEISNVNTSEIKAIMENNPSEIRKAFNTEGKLTGLWVKWKEYLGLAENMGPREFFLDRYSGQLNFRTHNDMLESGKTDILVNYSYGGGVIGNINKNEISGLLVSVPGIDKVTNFTSTYGGSDRGNFSVLERIGNSRILHRDRAVTLTDFENIALEHFSEIRYAKCFTGYDDKGNEKPGAVTLVVATEGEADSNYKSHLCIRIKNFFDSLIISTLKANSLFYVTPAIDLQLTVNVTVVPVSLDNAAELEKQLISLIDMIIERKKCLDDVIGKIPSKAELLSILKKAENVAFVRDISLEGRYFRNNKEKFISLDDSTVPLYAIAGSGKHCIKYAVSF